jgi:chromosome segregation protein
LQEQVPALDEQRRAGAGPSTARGGKLADIWRAAGGLRALQEKVQTEGKLKPWLAKHGLDGLAGLWTQVHIEPAGRPRWKPRCASA